MRSLTRALSLLLLLIFIPIQASVHALAAADADSFVSSVADGILAYKENAAGVSDTQDFIDTYLTVQAGVSSEWYVLGLSQSESYDFRRYERAMLSYLDSHDVYSATTRQKYALALICAGSSSRFISDTVNNSIGEQGVMSLIFGLHLLNNGCESAYHTTDSVIADLLSDRTPDGGWAIMGSRMDVDVTAMALSALSPYYHLRSDVTQAIDEALSLLSEKQNPDGGYTGFGGANCESTAQVLCALSCLGINAQSDSRFIKNGASVLDGMLRYRLSDGSFSHTESGGSDESATVQAYYSLIAYLRMLKGKNSLYLIDRRSSFVKPSQGSNPSAYTPPSKSDVRYAPNAAYEEEAVENIIIYEYEDAPSTQPTAAEDTAVTEPDASTGGAASSTLDESSPNQLSAADAATSDSAEKREKGGYKLTVILIIAALALLLSGALFLMKKRHFKNYLFLWGVALILILFVLLTDFSSKESYYHTTEKEQVSGEVTMQILCRTVKDEKNAYIPIDGVILQETSFSYSEGETVYDVLLEASKKYEISVDAQQNADMVYVRAINHLYEFDYGELSGWMYLVNGETPSVGCDQYTLTDGDRIEWLYTTNMGEDLSR